MVCPINNYVLNKIDIIMYEMKFWVDNCTNTLSLIEKILNCMGIYIVGERTGKMYAKCDD